MPRTEGPPCPKPERVRELLELVGDEAKLTSKDSNDIVDALDWLATMLENRALYHKKQNIKNRVLRDLAKEYGLDDQANLISDETLHSFVSAQKPDLDVYNTLKPSSDDKGKRR
jgi:hypothetical protein